MKKKLVGVLFILISLMLLACGNEASYAGERVEKGKQETQQKESVASNSVDASLIGKRFSCGDYEYTVQENGTVYISGYIGSEADLTLPTELDGFLVSGVADEGFKGAESIVSLIIPGTVQEIGKKAFAECINLNKVVIEDGVKVIEYRAFQNETNNNSTISEVIIPDSIVKMGDHPFGLINEVSRESNGLLYIGKFVVDSADSFNGHIEFDKDMLGIADSAFEIYNSRDARIIDSTIEIPEGVRYIGEAAFAGQDNIDYFKVPASVQEIGPHAMLFDYVNNEYELYYSNNTRKIYGISGSAAEQYAEANGLNFVIVNN